MQTIAMASIIFKFRPSQAFSECFYQYNIISPSTSIDHEGGVGSGEADMPRPNIGVTRGDSATDPPSNENPPTEGLGITRADTDTPSITIARGHSTVSPINSGDTDSPSVKEPRDSRDIRSETGDSSEEISPIHNPRG